MAVQWVTTREARRHLDHGRAPQRLVTRSETRRLSAPIRYPTSRAGGPYVLVALEGQRSERGLVQDLDVRLSIVAFLVARVLCWEGKGNRQDGFLMEV